MDYSLAYFAILIITGFLAGIINVMAGGGSNLTLPALMLTGMPADIANATNRVAIFLQCVVGVRGYQKHGKIDTQDMFPVLGITMVGGATGAILASVLSADLLKPLLLGTMVGVAFLILVCPSVVAPPVGTPTKQVKNTPLSWLALFVAGTYGGFVQAGVGFLLITAFAGTLRYDLVRSNAWKLMCSLAFTGVALVVFIVDDLIAWVPGLVLAVGAMVGAAVAVKISLNVSQRVMKWFLFCMTIAASTAVIFL